MAWRVISNGALQSFGEEIQTQNFYIYNIIEALTQTQKYIFFFHN